MGVQTPLFWHGSEQHGLPASPNTRHLIKPFLSTMFCTTIKRGLYLTHQLRREENLAPGGKLQRWTRSYSKDFRGDRLRLCLLSSAVGPLTGSDLDWRNRLAGAPDIESRKRHPRHATPRHARLRGVRNAQKKRRLHLVAVKEEFFFSFTTGMLIFGWFVQALPPHKIRMEFFFPAKAEQ